MKDTDAVIGRVFFISYEEIASYEIKSLRGMYMTRKGKLSLVYG